MTVGGLYHHLELPNRFCLCVILHPLGAFLESEDANGGVG